MGVSATCYIIHYKPFWMNLSHHIKQIIVSDSEMNLIPRRMSNDDSDMECYSDVESDSEVNFGEEVNVG